MAILKLKLCVPKYNYQHSEILTEKTTLNIEVLLETLYILRSLKSIA